MSTTSIQCLRIGERFKISGACLRYSGIHARNTGISARLSGDLYSLAFTVHRRDGTATEIRWFEKQAIPHKDLPATITSFIPCPIEIIGSKRKRTKLYIVGVDEHSVYLQKGF